MPDLLSKASAVDFSENSFPMDSLVITKFSQISLQIEKLHNQNTFQLWTDQSLRIWLCEWLQVSTQEYQN